AVAALAIGPIPWPDRAEGARSRVVAPLLARRLDTVAKANGAKLGAARCEPTRDPRRYTCSVVGAPDGVELRVSRGANRWSVRDGVGS
ncbi:MAG: hypothetical protein JWM86_1910, partial [Thermoleophilia bacterium]|nr:hypothetical protein [Thermoleophilia bacterium]